MADDKTTVYRITYDVEGALNRLQTLRGELRQVDKLGKSLSRALFKGGGRSAAAPALSGAKIAGSERVQRMLRDEQAARDKLTSAISQYSKGVKSAEKAAVQAGKSIERIVREDERVTRAAAREKERVAKAAEREIQKAIKERAKVAKAAAREQEKAEKAAAKAVKVSAREIDKAAKAAARAREQFKRTFLSIGKSSSFGMGSMVRNAAAAAAAYISLYKVISKIGEAKDRHLRFDELTTAAMTIAHAGDKAFEHGAKGAERYRDALRAAANDVKASAEEMADSALFWVKAGQTNTNTITELSKIGTMFARANRDAANNVLDQARANDILSDALQLFRKDTSTTEKAREEATALGDKLTAAANASNIVVEQLFDYSKKVAGLFKTGEVPDEEIMAIAASLASAGLKEESGVHVRRILTRLAQGNVQKMLQQVGITVADEKGMIRSFGDIFGELQEVLKDQKPLERMSFLKDLFGQRAVATAAAMAGLQEEGLPAETSIKAIIEKIDEGTGIAQRNQEQWLQTTAGRVQALTSTWGNAFDKMLADSGIIEKLLSGLEGIDPKDILEWLQKTAVPALEAFGATMRDTVIPGIKIAAENLYEWFSPALSLISSLLGGTTASAEGFGKAIATLVKLWVKWRIAMLAIKGLRMVDWLATFTKQMMAAGAASKGMATATTTAMGNAKGSISNATGSVGKLQKAFGGMAAFLAGWEVGTILYDNLVAPMITAQDELEKLGYDLADTLRRDLSKRSVEQLEKDLKQFQEYQKESEESTFLSLPGMGMIKQMGDFGAIYGEAKVKVALERAKDAKEEKKQISAGPHAAEIWGLRADWLSAQKEGIPETLVAQDAYKNALNEELTVYKGERERLEKKWEEAYNKSLDATGDERDMLRDELGSVADRLEENAKAIQEYTGDLDDLAGVITKSYEENRISAAAESAKRERKEARQKAFQGGETEPINPFITPMFSGIDQEGNRIINLALQRGNAAEYFQKSPEARESLKRELKSNKQIFNVHFGDKSVSVTAKTDAKPQEIAKVVKDEFWKIERQNQEDVQRILGATVPGEI